MCLNNGVCRPLLLNFTCECLGTSYSGHHCEITTRTINVYQVVSKSFGYIVILFLAAVALFVITMDVLKYNFRIDITENELEEIRKKKKRTMKRKSSSCNSRYIYVNAPAPPITQTEEPSSIVEETTV